MKQKRTTRLAIITPSIGEVSETFIQAHIEFLKPLHVYHHGRIPEKVDGRLVQSPWLWRMRWVIGKLLKIDDYHYLKGFRNSLKKNRINVILAEYGTTGAHIFELCKELGIELIVHFHGFDASRYDVLGKFRSKYLGMFNYAKSIIAVSNEMKRDLMNLGCSENKVVINPYGPRSDFFDLLPKYESQNLLFVGRFVDKKAPFYLILAFERIHKENPDARLIMVGDGPLFNACSNLISYYKLDEKVQLLGKLPHSDVIGQFKEASVFIQHSVKALDGDKEGLPVAILEAGAAGLPVVATYHAGISDTVVDNKTGFLVEEHDVDAFAARMKTLLQSQSLRKKVGANAKRRICDNFSMEQHIQVLMNCIDNLESN